MFYLRIFVGLVLALALMGVACGDDGEGGTGAVQTSPQQDEVGNQEGAATNEPTAGNDTDDVDKADEEPTVGSDAGRVTIGDVTYVFDIDHCQVATDGTEIDIAGQGTGPDGRPSTMRATRRGAIDSIQVRLSEGLTVFLAATGTSDALGGEVPSFEVDGRKVTTAATFYTPEELEKGVDAIGLEGSFVVNCP